MKGATREPRVGLPAPITAVWLVQAPARAPAQIAAEVEAVPLEALPSVARAAVEAAALRKFGPPNRRLVVADVPHKVRGLLG
jgi:hypothetical protein